ncbi:hypothetical protein B0H13DRAFT_1927942 [Mycena leptocephala]|nr:hypothetical protein B0H13DRAFT_1927942 [Mycena leptocephala]
MPVSITAILPFASSSPPPEPLVVSVWATDIYLPNSPIPTAHRDITRFVVSAPAPKVASSPELSPMNLPPYIPTTFLTTALSVTVPAPGTAEPATQKDDSPPGSPLTDISELDDAPTLSAPDSTKIPRPTSAARVPFSVLFPDWDSKRLDELQVKTAKSWRNFTTSYDGHWATVHLLQAHLKAKSSSAKKVATKKPDTAHLLASGVYYLLDVLHFAPGPLRLGMCPRSTIVIHAGAVSFTMPNNRLSITSPPNNQTINLFVRGRLYPALGRRSAVFIHVVSGNSGNRYPCVESIMGGSRTQPYVHDVRVQVVLTRPNGLVISQFRCFFKRHQLLPYNNALDVRGDVVIMKVDKDFPDLVINMVPSEYAVADFVAEEPSLTGSGCLDRKSFQTGAGARGSPSQCAPACPDLLPLCPSFWVIIPRVPRTGSEERGTSPPGCTAVRVPKGALGADVLSKRRPETSSRACALAIRGVQLAGEGTSRGRGRHSPDACCPISRGRSGRGGGRTRQGPAGAEAVAATPGGQTRQTMYPFSHPSCTCSIARSPPRRFCKATAKGKPSWTWNFWPFLAQHAQRARNLVLRLSSKAQSAPAVITRAGGAFVPSARGGNLRGAAGAGNVEGEEAASLSCLPSEFQRAATVRRLRPECAPGLRGAQRVWGTSRVRGRCPSDAVRGPGGAFGAEVVAAPADDRRHRNAYVLDSSHTAGGPTSRRRAGGLESAVGMVDGGGKRIESGVVTSRHGRFFSIRDSRSSSRSLHFDQTSMPKIQQEPGRMERQRRRELVAITRIRDPIEQCLAHVATPRHKDHGGELYTLFRVFGVHKLEVKSGYSIDTVRRQFEYRDNLHLRQRETSW